MLTPTSQFSEARELRSFLCFCNEQENYNLKYVSFKHSRLAHTAFCLPQSQHGPTSSKSHKLEPYLMPYQEETQN